MTDRYTLERSGRPELEQLERNVQRALDRVSVRTRGLATPSEASAYTPSTPADWSGDAPTTIGEALDRIAAVVAAAHGAIP